MIYLKAEKPLLKLEEVLSSKGRIKILSLLAIENEMNISRIIEKTNLNHKIVHNHLNYLCTIDFVQEKQYGRIKIYRFKTENIFAKALKNLLFFWSSKENLSIC